MDYKKLTEDIKKILPHKIPYGTLVGAPWPYTEQGDMVYEEPEHYLMEQAATAIAELLPYKEAIERLGAFGALFLAYNGDPRGPIGRAGNTTVDQEALSMDAVTDVDGGVWRPVQESVLQDLLKQLDWWKKKSFEACYEKQALEERAKLAEKSLVSRDMIFSSEYKLLSKKLSAAEDMIASMLPGGGKIETIFGYPVERVRQLIMQDRAKKPTCRMIICMDESSKFTPDQWSWLMGRFMKEE